MNRFNISKLELFLAAGLFVLMALTRTHYFQWTAVIPNPSLAVFFVAGFYLRSNYGFIGFSVLAYLCDYWVLIMGGEGCFTSAYGFIFLGYFIVWAAAKWLAGVQNLYSRSGVFKIITTVLLSISTAFLISNASFYLFSGHFSDLNLSEYVVRVVRYYPPYIFDPLSYLAITAVIDFLVTRRANRESIQ